MVVVEISWFLLLIISLISKLILCNVMIPSEGGLLMSTYGGCTQPPKVGDSFRCEECIFFVLRPYLKLIQMSGLIFCVILVKYFINRKLLTSNCIVLFFAHLMLLMILGGGADPYQVEVKIWHNPLFLRLFLHHAFVTIYTYTHDVITPILANPNTIY